jgi:outer membrane protein assembly factor BamB
VGPAALPTSHTPADVELPGADWPTYLGEVTRNAANLGEIELSSTYASKLTLLWSYTTHKSVESSPAIAGGKVYIGSTDGYEYALNSSTGKLEWKTFLGLSAPNNCSHAGMGIVSSATESNGTVYVGGGNGYWDALNSSTGQIEWHFYIGNTSRGYYNWASPLIADGFAYIGVASQCDDPLVHAGLWQVSLTTHEGVFFPTTPVGSIGSSIWGSPSYDAATNTVFAATGNPNGLKATTYSESILAWNATTMKLLGHWQVPKTQNGLDADFGTTPTLLRLSDGTSLLVATNKNGITYALNPSDLAAGPIWQSPVSYLVHCPTSDCPVQPPNVAPVAYGDGLLFAGGANTTIDGANYSGSIRALYPSNGTVKWVLSEPGDVLGAPAYANGLLAVAGGDVLRVLDASTGAILWKYTGSEPFESAPAIARGIIYVGSTNGKVYAFGLLKPPKAYAVTFRASGIPHDVTWAVTFAGITQSTRSESLSFEEVNGS